GRGLAGGGFAGPARGGANSCRAPPPPPLLITAVNDPFIPASALPRAAVTASRWLEADFVEQGGHVGFLEGFGGRHSWAENRALAFLRCHLPAAICYDDRRVAPGSLRQRCVL